MKGLLALLIFAFAAGAQQPPGQLVDAGGYRVHIRCTGEGEPTVMIVGAGFSFDWSLVQDEAARFTRVCTWDPPGTAWSDPGPGPACTDRVTALHAVLNNSGIRKPYILVGLSAGALVARLYAKEYPAEVAGMVIVDHAFIDISPATPPATRTSGLDSPPVLLEMTPVVITPEDDPGFHNLPDAVQALHRWAASLNPSMPTVETVRECLASVGTARLDDLPVAVVSTANDSPGYADLQSLLLKLSDNSRQFVAGRSFHSIEMSEPGVIVAAIRWAIDKLRPF